MQKDVTKDIINLCSELQELLLSKNKQYGNSALEPMGIFSRGSAEDLIRIRMDDKLNRLMQGDDSIESDEDVLLDLAGYIILLLITIRRGDRND